MQADINGHNVLKPVLTDPVFCKQQFRIIIFVKSHHVDKELPHYTSAI